MVIHQVYFWLKDGYTKEDFDKMVNALRSLKVISLVKEMHVGLPAHNNDRPVLDKSYTMASNVLFETAQDEMDYQVHPLHVAFLDEHRPMWQKVVVYDVDTSLVQ